MLGKVAHGAEYEGDLLRMMRNVTCLLRHFREQHPVTRHIKTFEGGQLEAQLVPSTSRSAATLTAKRLQHTPWRVSPLRTHADGYAQRSRTPSARPHISS